MMENYRELRFLVFEADLPHGELIKIALQQMGCWHVTLADDPDQAIAIMQESRIDAVLTGLYQGGTGGSDFVTWLRNPAAILAPGVSLRGLPVLGMVENDNRLTLRMAVRLGVDLVAVKPLCAKILKSKITHMMSHPVEQVVSPAYAGPCRRRMPERHYRGPERRMILEWAN
jgi:CheY-like chemotaxis protein